MMNAKLIFTFAGGVVVGLILGAMLFSAPGPSTVTRGGAPVTPVQPQQPQVDKLRLQREISQAEQIVKTDPSNYRAWKKLGDNYFDLAERKKSIAAYRKALAINDGDPNVWTDMGVMYRREGDFTKALESFDEAIRRGPTHATSRANKGVVLVYDLQRYAEGIAAWEDFLRLQPSGAQADQVRQNLERARQLAGAKVPGGIPSAAPTVTPVEPKTVTPVTPVPAAPVKPKTVTPVEPAPAPGQSDPSSYFPKPEQQ